MTTQQDGTEAAGQTDDGLTTEQSVGSLGVIQGAGVVLEAGFQIEDGAQTATQIFNTLEADTRTLNHRGVHAELAAGAVSSAVDSLAGVHDASIDNAVDGEN